jgi:peptidoglycan/xylan/chitin deacetylase (PgdA/CDA1 family)
MVKNDSLFVLSLLSILFVSTILTACGNEPESLEAQESNPSPIADEALAAVTIPPVPSPTLAAPVISVNSAETAVPEPTELLPSPTVEIVEAAKETAVPPTETPPPVHASVPLPTPSGTYSWTLRVPILMYHYISEPPPGADIYRTDLSVSPDNFRQQMTFLAENGYTPIDLYQLSAAITAKIELPEKPVILTFDDGYLDNYENAFPILQEFGFTSTFFVITDYADQGAEGYANWEQLQEMTAAGMRIESHTKNHPDLTEKDRDSIIFQVLGSQETIAAHIGYTPRYLCYPGGRYNEEIKQILAELDMWGAVTTQGGTWHGFEERYEWARQRMRNDTTMEEFIRLVDPDGTIGGKTPGE